jgi:hypothetical protein
MRMSPDTASGDNAAQQGESRAIRRHSPEPVIAELVWIERSAPPYICIEAGRSALVLEIAREFAAASHDERRISRLRLVDLAVPSLGAIVHEGVGAGGHPPRRGLAGQAAPDRS